MEASGNPVSRRPFYVLVPLVGLIYIGVLIVIVASFESPPTSASNPYPIIADVIGVIELVAAFLIWRGMRVGYVTAAVMNVVFLGMFSRGLLDDLTGIEFVRNLLRADSLVSVLLLGLVYVILKAR